MPIASMSTQHHNAVRAIPATCISHVADLVGKKLKDFFILRRLGRGAMAEVYLAQQLSLGRQVAFKVLNAELARDPNYVRRFHHEARAAAALVHGGIVQIYEVGEDDGVHYIAQEYVAGRNLGEVIRSSGSLVAAAHARYPAASGRRALPKRPAKASSTATSSPKTSCSPAAAK